MDSTLLSRIEARESRGFLPKVKYSSVYQSRSLNSHNQTPQQSFLGASLLGNKRASSLNRKQICDKTYINIRNLQRCVKLRKTKYNNIYQKTINESQRNSHIQNKQIDKENQPSHQQKRSKGFDLIKILAQKQIQFVKDKQRYFTHQNNSLMENLHSDSKFYSSITQPKKIKIKTKNNDTKKQVVKNQQLKTRKSIVLQKRNSVKLIDYRIKKDRMQYFKVCVLQNICFSQIFPIQRFGCTLASIEGNVYLYGGYALNSKQNVVNRVLVHSYDMQRQSWVALPCKGQTPLMPSCYHTSESYKNYIIMVGGFCINVCKQKRFFNNQITSYNVQSSQYEKIRFNYCLRSHASTIFSNNLVVYGGINDKEEYLNQMHFLAFNSANMRNPVVISWHVEGENFPNGGIAYHKMVTSYDLDIQTRNKLPVDGIFLFGGRDSKGRMSDQLMLFEANGTHSNVESLGKKWTVIQVQGKKPKARYDHAMVLLKSKASIFVIGGKDSEGIILRDMWCFNIKKLKWSEVFLAPQTNPIQKGIKFTAAAASESKIFVYGFQETKEGGNVGKTVFFHVQTQTFSFSNRKKSQRQAADSVIE